MASAAARAHTLTMLLRRLAKRLGLVLASLVGALLVAELAARALCDPIPRHPGREQGRIRMPAPNGPEIPPGMLFVPRPGGRRDVTQAGVGETPDRVIEYRVNADGFRGPRVPRERTPGVPRVVALGDSFTWGTGVQEDGTWPRQLERALEARRVGSEVEVLNWGVEAYNTLQEAAFLEWQHPQWRPDLVLVCAYINDASGEQRGGGAAAPVQSAQLDWIRRLGLTSGVWPRGEERTPAERRTMALRRASRLADVLAHRAYRHLRGSMTEENYRADWSAGSPGLAAVEEGLQRMAAAARAGEFELVVLMYPDLSSLDEDYPYTDAHATLRAACERLGLEFHDLLEPLRGMDARSLHAHVHDHHPNRGCNALVAAFLAELLEARLF